MVNDLMIRRYQPSDRKIIKQIHYAALAAVDALLPGGPWNDDDLDDIPSFYFNGGDFFVGLVADSIVCLGGLKRVNDRTAEIKRMRVHPEHQHQGYGQTMLKKIEKRAKELGYTKLCLDTTTRQTSAQEMYRKNGYVEVRRGKYAGYEIVFFEKILDQKLA